MLKSSLKLVFVAAIISLMGISTQTFAQDYCYFDNWSSNAGMEWWNNNIPQEYALTADQITKINNIRAKNNKSILPLQKKVQSLRMEFDRYNSDDREMKLDRNKIRGLEDKISKINLDTQKQIKKILTNEQLKYFDNGGYGWWDMDGNCWYSNHGNIQYGDQKTMMYHGGCCD